MQTQGKFLMSIFIVLALCIVFAGCDSKTGLQSQIQKEFDSNPFLKEQKITLTVVKEENGYATVEIEGGGNRIIEYIGKGNDITGNVFPFIFEPRSDEEIKSVNALKKAIETAKAIKGVKVISLVNSPKNICEEGRMARINKDFNKAASLYKKAADRGLADAQYDLAGMYCGGLGVPRDYSKALELYKNVAERKDENYHKYIARRELGGMYEKGLGVPQDYSQAIEWYLKAAASKENDFAGGLYELAWLYGTCKDPQYRDGQKSLEYALKAYSKSQQYSGAHRILAAAYAASGNFEKAVEEQEKEINYTKTNVQYSNKDYERKVFNTLEKQLALYKAHQAYVQDEGDAAKFCGIWEYEEYGAKKYFKVTEEVSDRLKFLIGYKYKGEIVWAKPWIKNADGIYLRLLDGKLHGEFVSSNFYATHGEEFTYKITLDIKSNNKLFYSVYSSIRGETDKREATKISD